MRSDCGGGSMNKNELVAVAIVCITVILYKTLEAMMD